MCSPQLFIHVLSSDNTEYICLTCDKKAKKGKVPCQAVMNKMAVDEIPADLSCLEKLESILIAQRLIFEKLIIHPKGKQKKLK